MKALLFHCLVLATLAHSLMVLLRFYRTNHTTARLFHYILSLFICLFSCPVILTVDKE